MNILVDNLKIQDDSYPRIRPEDLGSREFLEKYNIEYAYIAGSMYKGIGSKEIVVAMGKEGILGYLGTGGMSLDKIEEAIKFIQLSLSEGQSYGMNLLSDISDPIEEAKTVELYLKYGIRFVEASAYMQVSPSLVYYRLSGVRKMGHGDFKTPNNVLAKISRPEVANQFMSPAPKKIIQELLDAGKITEEEAEIGRFIPIASEICVEADSGGHTDAGVATALLPSIQTLRDRLVKEYQYNAPIHVGLAGGIGTPKAAAAAFAMGADYILTGSINQCTVESGTSDAVKNLLQDIDVQDTEYAPAGDMFEYGAKVQVLKKGVLFPSKANKLYELYMNNKSIEDIDEKTKKQLQEKIFKKSFESVWQEVRSYYNRNKPQYLSMIESNPKAKMAAIFKWYFMHTNQLALEGDEKNRVDFQVHCGPSLGSFNQWVKGTKLESWKKRRVAEIGRKIMEDTAELMSKQYGKYFS